MTKSEFLKKVEELNNQYLKLLDVTNDLIKKNSNCPRIIDTMQMLNSDITRGISSLSCLKSDAEKHNKEEIETRKLFNVEPISVFPDFEFEDEKESE